jgi:ribosomal protein S18 acetylase RimI-like enzyme
MAASLNALDLAAPTVPGLTIVPMGDAAGLADWMTVWTHDGEEQRAPREQLYVSLGLDNERPLRHWVARLDGVPVAVAQTFLHAEVAGLYCVSVFPEQRRRGIGRALVCAALAAEQQRGARLAVLAPSPEGQALYNRLGFQLLPSPAVLYAL